MNEIWKIRTFILFICFVLVLVASISLYYKNSYEVEAEKYNNLQEEYKNYVIYSEGKLDELILSNSELINKMESELEKAYNISEVKEYEIDRETFTILCKCVQAEAGPKNYESQKMVTKVILNRVESSEFPDNIIDVIYQPGQFLVVDTIMDNQQVSIETEKNVLDVLVFDYDMPSNVLYFHSGDNEKGKNVYKCEEGTIFCYNY